MKKKRGRACDYAIPEREKLLWTWRSPESHNHKASAPFTVYPEMCYHLPMTMISVTILTKNSEKHLHEVLESTSTFDEVIVYDTGSTDSTFDIAKKFSNVVIRHGKLDGFGPTHNLTSECAIHDWILSIDSDEIVSPEMVKEIHKMTLNETCVYSFPRHNYYNGKWIRWCGWYPDHQIRLYHRRNTRFSDAQVHESILTENMQLVPLKCPIKHYSYACTADFLDKMQTYSDLFAKQYAGKKRSSVWTALGHATFTFFKNYLLKRGFLGGFEGFVISWYNANTAFYKYIKLMEVNRALASAKNCTAPVDAPTRTPSDSAVAS